MSFLYMSYEWMSYCAESHSDESHSDKCHFVLLLFWWASGMLRVAMTIAMLSVDMLTVVMLGVVMQRIVMLVVIIQSVLSPVWYLLFLHANSGVNFALSKLKFEWNNDKFFGGKNNVGSRPIRIFRMFLFLKGYFRFFFKNSSLKIPLFFPSNMSRFVFIGQWR